jgi:nucleoid-associated protein YgaU
MKLSTLAVAAAALLTVSNAALAADTPASSAAPAASSTPDAATPAEPSKPADSAEPAHKSKSADATDSGPKSPEARCAAKIGHSTGDNKWEFNGDKAEQDYVACVGKAD